VPPTTFVEVVHQSLKYVPFTGLEVTTDDYFNTMASLITPDSNFQDYKLSDDRLNLTPDSLVSTKGGNS
jgi:hypothetical protein